MAETILRVSHASLGQTPLAFTDDELPSHTIRPVQKRIEQESQTGNLTEYRIGNLRYEFDFRFEIFYRSTLLKLSQIYMLGDVFTIYPLIMDVPLTSYNCIWGDEPFREEFIFGRTRAQWDFEVTWKEALTGVCPDIFFES